MVDASIHINKLAAAKRQIQAAIRMYFMLEDELAVHVIAAAAYGLIKDIKKSRGLSEAADAHKISIFFVVRDFRRGTLPADMLENTTLMKQIEEWAAHLPKITADSRLSEVRVTIGKELERQYWQDTFRAANFLKHADRDTDYLLPMDAVNNLLLLAQCTSAYQDVAPDDLGHEGFFFSAYLAAQHDSHQNGNTEFEAVVRSIRKLDPERQMELCYQTIQKLRSGT